MTTRSSAWSSLAARVGAVPALLACETWLSVAAASPAPVGPSDRPSSQALATPATPPTWPALQTYSVSHLLPFRTEAALPAEASDAVTQIPSRLDQSPRPETVRSLRREPRLMRIGGLLLGIGYAPALALALALAPQAGQPGSPTVATNYTLLVPVAGPLISGLLAPIAAAPGTTYGAITTWTLPLTLTVGLVQVTGFALLTAGAIPRLRPSSTTTDPLDINFPPWQTR